MTGPVTCFPIHNPRILIIIECYMPPYSCKSDVK